MRPGSGQANPESPSFTFVRGDICDRALLERVLKDSGARRVLHLAAQPGVRHSARQPATHVDTNIVGFANVLEVCRAEGVEHLVFASSSSVALVCHLVRPNQAQLHFFESLACPAG